MPERLRTRMLLLVVVHLGVLLPPAMVQAQALTPADDETRKEIIALQDRYVELRKAGKVEEVLAMFDDSYRVVWVDGRVLGKNEVAALLKATSGSLDEIGYSDREIFRMGEYAVSIAAYHFSGTLNGQRFDSTAKAVDVFAKRNGKWVGVFGTNTEMKNTPDR